MTEENNINTAPGQPGQAPAPHDSKPEAVETDAVAAKDEAADAAAVESDAVTVEVDAEAVEPLRADNDDDRSAVADVDAEAEGSRRVCSRCDVRPAPRGHLQSYNWQIGRAHV